MSLPLWVGGMGRTGRCGSDTEFGSIDDGSCNELSKKVHLGVGERRVTGGERQRAIPGRRLADCALVTLRLACRAVSCYIGWSTR